MDDVDDVDEMDDMDEKQNKTQARWFPGLTAAVELL